MATREVGIDQRGDYVLREQTVGTLARIKRSDTKDIQTAIENCPFDFEIASGAAAQSLMGSITTAHSFRIDITSSSSDTPVNGTVVANFGSGVQTLTGSSFMIKQATASITSLTVTQASGSTARIRAIVSGNA